MTSLLSLFAALGAAASVLAIVAGLTRRGRQPTVRDRLEMATRRRTTALEHELRQPLMERAIRPMLAGLRAVVLTNVKQKSMAKIAEQIAHADLEDRLDAPNFATLRMLSGIGVGAAMVLGLLALKAGIGGMVFGLVGGVLGYMYPLFWLRSKVRQRQTVFRLALPDAIDLITLCLDAMPFEQALRRVVDKSEPIIGKEFGQLLSEITISGLKRSEALHRLADRVGIDELRSLVTAVTQADTLGTPLAKVFKLQAEDIRVRRRLRAETLAREAPVKMMIPLVLLVFPPLFIVILGPMVPQILHAVAPGLRL